MRMYLFVQSLADIGNKHTEYYTLSQVSAMISNLGFSAFLENLARLPQFFT